MSSDRASLRGLTGRTVVTAVMIFAILWSIPAGMDAVSTSRLITTAGASLLDRATAPQAAPPSEVTPSEATPSDASPSEAPTVEPHEHEVPPELLPFVVDDVELPAAPPPARLPRPANPARIRLVEDFADWAPFERSVRANLGPDASVDQLDRFAAAARGVCQGKLTVRNAAIGYQVGSAALSALSAFVPAQCHLVPGDGSDIAGMAITESWSEMILLR